MIPGAQAAVSLGAERAAGDTLTAGDLMIT